MNFYRQEAVKNPEVIPRSCHWRDHQGVKPSHWKQIIDQLDVPGLERGQISTALAGFASTLGRLESIARDCGVKAEVLDLCLQSIETQATQLQALSVKSHPWINASKSHCLLSRRIKGESSFSKQERRTLQADVEEVLAGFGERDTLDFC